MAKDVAQRELDQANFRISNLGQPTEVNDATKTDNTTIPKAASGSGSPGTSLLAAPADHVHPATVGPSRDASIEREHEREQVAWGAPAILWEGQIDFPQLPGARTNCLLLGFGKSQNGAGKLELKLGGSIGQPDGTTVLEATVSSENTAAFAAEAQFDKPTVVTLVKLVASTPSDEAKMWVRGKTFAFRSV